MQFSFQHRLSVADVAPGTLRLTLVAPHAGRSRELALVAFEHGLAAFDRGMEPIERLEFPAEPTLDDMLAAEFLSLLAAGKSLPARARAFAEYARVARKGQQPGKLPLEASLEGIYQAVRNAAPQDLSSDANAAQFMAGWKRMSARILAAAEAGTDPFVTPLFDDPAFGEEHAFLRADLRVYKSDVTRGEQWLVNLPAAPPSAAALVLREPKSLFFKYWFREDEHTPTGQPYVFLATQWGCGDWVFSTDPAQRLSLRVLAERLQQEEAKQDPEKAAANPWFDGAPYQHTLVAAPKGGSALSDEWILKTVKSWTRAQAIRKPRQFPVLTSVGAVAALLLIGIAVHFFNRPPGGAEIERHVPEEPPLVAAQVNGRPIARSLVSLRESAALPVSSLELKVVPRPGSNDVTFNMPRQVNQPVKFWVSLSPTPNSPPANVSLTVNRDPHELTCQPAADGSAKSAECSATLKAGENSLVVTFDDAGDSATATTVRLHWQADLAIARDLLLLSVGVSDYAKPTPKLPCATSDATALVKAFRQQAGPTRLFRSLLIDDELQDGPALNEQATRGRLLDRLGWLKKAAAERRNCLVVVTLSGHGKTFDDSRQGSYYYLAHGYQGERELGHTAVGWAECLDYFKSMPCPVVVLIDTCHSGAALTRSANPREELERAVAEAMQSLAKSENGIVVIAACRSDQMAIEDENWKHGALTLAVLELLERKKLYTGPAKSNKAQLPLEKPVLTLEDLVHYAADRIEDLVGKGQAVVVKQSDGLYLRDIPFAAQLTSPYSSPPTPSPAPSAAP